MFAREVAAPDGRDRPFLVFLQGGPGQEAPRPTGRPVLTGMAGTGAAGLPGADARPARHRPLHAVRRTGDRPRRRRRAARALPRGRDRARRRSLPRAPRCRTVERARPVVRRVLLAALPEQRLRQPARGVLHRRSPARGRPVDDIYSTTFDTMRMLNRRYHRRFPADREQACSAARPVRRRRGPRSRRRTDHPAAAAHHRQPARHGRRRRGDPLPARARPPISRVRARLRRDAARSTRATRCTPCIHESSYADGVSTRWSAERVQPEDFRGDSLLLTGEHLFPWHFEDSPDLRPYRDVAAILAEHEWPQLYDAEILAQVESRAPPRSTPTTRSWTGSFRADRRPAARDAPVAHRRVPAQRAAQRRRSRARPIDRARTRDGLVTDSPRLPGRMGAPAPPGGPA